MIEAVNLSKQYKTRSGKHHVLSNVSLTIRPGERVGILGRNGSGKSTLIRLIAGAEYPTSGTVRRSMTVSWPIAFAGAFQAGLSGFDNCRFICRIYGEKVEDKLDFLEDFAQLGSFLYEPIFSYSAGMRARLSFAISMAIDFDCYLIDEVIAVGDARFTEKCQEELFEKRGDKAKIIVSHDIRYVERHCERAMVLDRGRLISFDAISDAYDYYTANC